MDYASAYLEQTRAFGELVRSADLSGPVPTCPEWNIGQLFRHVGRGDRWAAQIVRDRMDTFLEFRSVEGGKPPPDIDDAVAWLNDGARLLVDAVELTGAETPVWTFLGPRPARWWPRRRLHENVVHRADAALAVGAEFDVDAAIAADAITEFLERIVIKAAQDGAAWPLEDADIIHLHATDPGLGDAGEWTIELDDGVLQWSHRHGKGTTALRGGAGELLLAMTRRIAVADTGIAMFGSEAVWRRWLDRTPF
ncbi:maleylpyruvate isomerase family mycothiol-dependent enzyme [Mycobacterium sp.]|uniref:maleylpyruvate isomerase family mycothiol-dependent enzyme n=1 Tax=Mycobacterium sp. TaxID=1785 RepID=UPI003A862CC7